MNTKNALVKGCIIGSKNCSSGGFGVFLMGASTQARVHSNSFENTWFGDFRGTRRALESRRHIFNNTRGKVGAGLAACFACSCSEDLGGKSAPTVDGTPRPTQARRPRPSDAPTSSSSAAASSAASTSAPAASTSSSSSSPEPELYGGGDALSRQPLSVMCAMEEHSETRSELDFQSFRLEHKFGAMGENISDVAARMTKYLENDVHAVPFGGFRQAFPGTIPNRTKILRLSNTNLFSVDFDMLRNLRDLAVLDLADNPLNPVPPSGVFRQQDFPSLRQLALAGVDLIDVTNSTFEGLRNTLQNLDISRPARFPRGGRALSFTGYRNLNEILWYTVHCPAGFFAASDTYFRLDQQSCVRCPSGTYKPSAGGAGPSVCEPCGSEYRDHDSDATTPCVRRAQFQVLRFARGLSTRRGGGCSPLLKFATGHPQSVGPVVVTRAINNASQLFQFSLEHAPKGFLVDPSTGQIEVRVEDDLPAPRASVSYNATLFAIDGLGARAVVEHLPIEIRMADGDVAANGPGGEPCKHGAVVDTIPFNYKFRCDCTETKFYGVNCELTEADSADWVYAVAVSVASIALAMLVVAQQRHRAWRQKKKERAPFSFAEMLHELEVEGTFQFAIQARKRAEVLPTLSADSNASDTSDDELLGALLGTGDDAHRAGAEALGLSLSVPKEIDQRHVTILDQLGAGAFGAVWEGLLVVPGTRAASGSSRTVQVAVKRPKQEKFDGVMREHMLKEAAIGAQFDHENIPRLIGVITSNNSCDILMELCSRGGLHGLLLQETFHPGRDAIAEPVVLGILCDVV